MSGLLIIVFVIFAVICKCSPNYYRFLLFALLVQFVSLKLPNLHPIFQWTLEWIGPLALMTFATLRDPNLTLGNKGIFLILTPLLIGFGMWDYYQAQNWTPSQLQEKKEDPATPTWKIFPGLPKEKSLKDESDGTLDSLRSDEWEEIISQEGGFRVLSPIPAVTRQERKKVQKHELLVTQTRIKDVHEGLFYVVLTTRYPKEFPLPSPQEQAQVAFEHLVTTYEYDKIIEMDAIEHNGLEGIGFHVTRSTTGDHLMGLILPSCKDRLYQVLVFTKGDEESSQLAEKFLFSFSPFKCDEAMAPLSS